MTAARKVPVVLAKFLAHGAVIGQAWRAAAFATPSHFAGPAKVTGRSALLLIEKAVTPVT